MSSTCLRGYRLVYFSFEHCVFPGEQFHNNNISAKKPRLYEQVFSSVQFSLFLPFQLYVYIYIYINIQIMKFEIKWRGSS